MSGLFITGVGTGVGKTLVTTILCHQLRAMGRSVTALKPVVSGFAENDPESDPALILRSLGTAPTPQAIASISPWRFAAPISPHLAARWEGRSVSFEEIVQFCREHRAQPGSIRLVEGAGGVMSPIASNGTCAHVIVRLAEPVVLVTGTYLGAISHTLTALGACFVMEVPVRGIVVSESVDGAGLGDMVATLRDFGGAETPIYLLPRLWGAPDERWRTAPDLTTLCEAGDE
jgi:dethiobiotin synthetase